MSTRTVWLKHVGGRALRIDENNISMTSKLLCNRAFMWPSRVRFARRDCGTRGWLLAGAIAALKLQRFEFAVQDASAALFFNPQYAKAYATRAAAHVELERCVHTKPLPQSTIHLPET